MRAAGVDVEVDFLLAVFVVFFGAVLAMISVSLKDESNCFKRGSSRRRGLAEVKIPEQAVTPALAAKATLLEAAKRAGRVESIIGIAPDHAGLQRVGHHKELAALVGPDAIGQTIGGIICLFDGFFGSAKGQHRQDRAEDLVLGDPVGWRHAQDRKSTRLNSS